MMAHEELKKTYRTQTSLEDVEGFEDCTTTTNSLDRETDLDLASILKEQGACLQRPTARYEVPCSA